MTTATITLPSGAPSAADVEAARVPVEGGLTLHRSQVLHASLESWCPQVSGRPGASE